MIIRLLLLVICKKYLGHQRQTNNQVKFPHKKNKALDLLQLPIIHFSTPLDILNNKNKISWTKIIQEQHKISEQQKKMMII